MKSQRKQFFHQKRLIYEWQQSLDSLTVYIPCPQLPNNVKKSSLFDIKIGVKELFVGIKGNPPYLKHQWKGLVDKEQSTWLISVNQAKKQDEITIEIQKAQKGVRWGAPFKGHENLNPLQQEKLKKKLMLERFQQQHPGFDFSDAQFNGQIPDARTFMGGVK